MNRFYKKINVWFTLPAVALFIIVVLIPFFMGLVYSFTLGNCETRDARSQT